MTQSRLRLTLYGSWLASLLASAMMLLLAPEIRGDETLGYEQVFSVIPAIVGLHVPALSVFAAYWFPQDERKRAIAAHVTRERAYGAISLTWTYLLIMLCVLAWPALIIRYGTDAIELPEAQSFVSRVNDAVKISLMLSPLALAPSAYVTRIADRGGQRRAKEGRDKGSERRS